MPNYSSFRRRLREWYESNRRPLPWRGTKDPYLIWVSEIMLQQTRVAAVLPYYERFVKRFPDAGALAQADEQEVLAMWSGLGYYRRARNLHRGARQIAAQGGFPSEYEAIRALPGVGEYTAAAIASIAFGLPHAVVDGNVLRVMARLENDGGDVGSSAVRRRLGEEAARRLDRSAPGTFNQAMMELGATICLPRNPRCSECPVAKFCKARLAGSQNQLPVKLRREVRAKVREKVLLIVRNGKVLMRRRGGSEGRLAGFWELPGADVPGARIARKLGEFRHAITTHDYLVEVYSAEVKRTPRGYFWAALSTLCKFPVTSMAKKAMRWYQ